MTEEKEALEEMTEEEMIDEMSDEELYARTFAILDILSVRYYPGRKPNIAKTYAGRLDTQPKACFDAVIGQITPLSRRFRKPDREHFKRMKRYVKEIEEREVGEKILEPSNFYLHFYHEKHDLAKLKGGEHMAYQDTKLEKLIELEEVVSLSADGADEERLNEFLEELKAIEKAIEKSIDIKDLDQADEDQYYYLTNSIETEIHQAKELLKSN